jgi:hypothetical protein
MNKRPDSLRSLSDLIYGWFIHHPILRYTVSDRNSNSLLCLFPLLFITEIITKQSPAVFIVMAVSTQIFPVRTIRGIIPVIAIFMVYGQEMTVCV